MVLNPLSKNRNTLGEQAYRAIRAEIISLRLEPGQMIYENELAAAFGVSRSPIREAFVMLTREELVEVLPQRGTRIAYISTKKVEEARFVRESLEASAFKAVAGLWREEDPHFQSAARDVEKLLEDQRRSLENEDYMTFLDLDEAFHQAILELFRNHTLLSVVTSMRGHLNRMRFLELKEAQHMTKLVGQHEAIFQAIRTNDEEGTERLLRHHLQQTRNELPHIFQKYAHYFQE